jgi:hypothetical protein
MISPQALTGNGADGVARRRVAAADWMAATMF